MIFFSGVMAIGYFSGTYRCNYLDWGISRSRFGSILGKTGLKVLLSPRLAFFMPTLVGWSLVWSGWHGMIWCFSGWYILSSVWLFLARRVLDTQREIHTGHQKLPLGELLVPQK